MPATDRLIPRVLRRCPLHGIVDPIVLGGICYCSRDDCGERLTSEPLRAGA